ncbi:MAG: threonine--tRNA ligase [Gemmataceae bacterium]|nr:threonine--tRNA ligase [Gemmataceae bacterium]
MITLKLPDGSVKEVAPGTTARQVAETIGKRLAQAAVAAKVDGEVIDLARELPPGEHTFQVLTEKDPDALDVLRHSCAHVMARAVLRLFPGTQLAFGPTIENGFYYDIDSPTPIREDDFPRIEAEMQKIVALAEPFERFERPTAEARGLCADLRQTLKVEHIDDLARDHPDGLSFYRQGEFIDLCRGPHLPHAGRIGAFKLLSIAGAYWKNDASRKQLQRLYGTAFFSHKDLDAYLHQLEEAKKRDHRLLGKQLKLFTISTMVGSGLILWMPKGAIVRGVLESFIKDELLKRGYQPVYTPHIGRLELYRTSGHFPYYRDAQFPPMYTRPAAGALDLCQYRLSLGELDDKRETEFLQYAKTAYFVPPDYERAATQAEKLEYLHRYTLKMLETMQVDLPAYRAATDAKGRAEALLQWLADQEGFLLKPMNCPHHIHIYKAEPRSYRDLPVRLAEFGTVYRYEQTGELNGMTRVRGFTQDDAHLFMTADQVEAELKSNIELVLFIFTTLGLSDYRVRIGLRDPASSKYVGDPADWDRAEKTLIDVVKNLGMNYSAEAGEAAFYGPKIDFVVRDCIGREWQLGTVQLDYNLPKRFDLEYIGPDNAPHRPIMIHRAPFGSLERFMGILIEHFAGAFPAWLAPEQVRLVTVSEKFTAYGRQVEGELRAHGFRVQGDYRPEKIGFKIREAQLEKVPYMLVIGEKEQSAGTVAVRSRSEGDLGAVPVAEFVARLAREVRERRLGR